MFRLVDFSKLRTYEQFKAYLVKDNGDPKDLVVVFTDGSTEGNVRYDF